MGLLQKYHLNCLCAKIKGTKEGALGSILRSQDTQGERIVPGHRVRETYLASTFFNLLSQAIVFNIVR